MLGRLNGQPQSRDALQCQLHRRPPRRRPPGTLQLHWTTRGASRALGSHPPRSRRRALLPNPGGGICRASLVTASPARRTTSRRSPRGRAVRSIPECSVLNRSTYLSASPSTTPLRLNAADAGGDGLGELSTASARNRSGGIGCGGGEDPAPRPRHRGRRIGASRRRRTPSAAAGGGVGAGVGAGGAAAAAARHAARRVRAVAHDSRATPRGARTSTVELQMPRGDAPAAVAGHAVGDVLVRIAPLPPPPPGRRRRAACRRAGSRSRRSRRRGRRRGCRGMRPGGLPVHYPLTGGAQRARAGGAGTQPDNGRETSGVRRPRRRTAVNVQHRRARRTFSRKK